MLRGNSKSQIPNEKTAKISLAADIFWSLRFKFCLALDVGIWTFDDKEAASGLCRRRASLCRTRTSVGLSPQRRRDAFKRLQSEGEFYTSAPPQLEPAPAVQPKQ